MPTDRTAAWGDDEVEATYVTGDTDPAGGGNFVVAEDTDAGTVLLEWDATAGEWVSRGPVNMSGNDLTNVGAIDATSLQSELVNTDQETITEPVVRAYDSATESQTYTDYLIETTASGTSETDIGEAIQTALDNGASRIVLPEGQYRYDSAIVPPAGHVTISGQGSVKGSNPSTIVDYDGTGTALDGVTNDAKVTLQRFWLAGPDATGTTTGVTSTGLVILQDVRISGFGTGWNPQDGTYYTAVVNSHIESNGIGVQGGANTMLFVNATVNSNNDDGIRTENRVRSFHVFASAVEENGGWGVNVTNNNTAPVGPVTISRNYIENNGSGGSGGAVRVSGNINSPSVTRNYFNNHQDGECHVRFDDVNYGFVGYNLAQDTTTGETAVGLDITGSALRMNIAVRENVRFATSTTPISDAGIRTKMGGIIGGYALGGVDLGATSTTDEGDIARADGTTATNADTLFISNGTNWVRVDGGETI